MNFEDITLSAMSQTQKDKYDTVPLRRYLEYSDSQRQHTK